MHLKYDMQINNGAINFNFSRLINQIYKLLPMREEGLDWTKPLENIMEEMAGMSRMLFDQHPALLKIACKLEGLFTLCEDDDFMTYRSVIFECLGLLEEIRKNVLK